VLGEQTWYMLETLIGLVWEPETQQEKRFIICSNFFRRGMRSGHIKMSPPTPLLLFFFFNTLKPRVE